MRCNQQWYGNRIGSEPLCNLKCEKTKIKSYGDKISTGFHGKKIPKQVSHCVCLSFIVIDSVCKITNSYYSLVFLKEGKYIEKERKIRHIIKKNPEIFDDDEDDDDS